MDANRAKSIIRSPDWVQVTHNGNPVKLENVEENNTAEVTYLGDRKRVKVPVDTLIEL